MKKISIILLTCMLLLCAGQAFAADEDINVVVNGVTLSEKGVAIEGRTMVPVRAICEAMGLEVLWWPTGLISIIDPNSTKSVELKIDSTEVFVGAGLPFEQIEVPPTVINGKTMIPVRFLADTFGLTTSWYNATKTVGITGEKRNTTDKVVAKELEEIQKQDGQASKKMADYTIAYPKMETNYEYFKSRGLEIIDYSINDSEVTVTLKNVSSTRESELIHVEAYENGTNIPLGYTTMRIDINMGMGTDNAPIGETVTIYGHISKAFMRDAYIVLGSTI